MNISHLAWMIEVDDCGSVTEAARKLFVTQSNLSTAIKSIENEVGFPVFERKARGMEATPRGRIFLGRARSIVQEFNNLEREFSQDQKVCTIAATRHLTFISDAVASVITEGISKTIVINECSLKELLEAVQSGEADFGLINHITTMDDFMNYEFKRRCLISEVLMETDPVVIISENHPLADKAILSQEDLAPIPLINFSESQSRIHTFDLQKNLFGINFESDLQIAAFVSDRATMFDLISKTTAGLVSGRISNEDLERYGLVLRPYEGSTGKVQCLFVKNAHAKLSHTASKLLQEMKTSIRLLFGDAYQAQ